MKRKFLAVVITAAMVAGALPGVAFAAAGEENEAELQVISDIQETESHEMSVHEMAVQTAETDQLPEISGTEKIADVEAVGNTERADVIDTQEELEAAIAQGGEIDLTGQRIELTRRLSIANDVVIRGGTLVGTDSVTGNLVTLMGNSITLDHVTIQTSAGNKSALHVYGTKLTVNGLSVDHSSAAGGAPIIINNGADAVFTGDISLTPGGSSWYGINVDSARADFSGASLNVTPVTDTQSVICREGNNAAVSGVGLTIVVTERDGGGNNQQTAYVADSNLAQFVAAKTAAGADISRIELQKDVTLTAPLVLSEAMTVSGVSDGFAINGSDVLGRENVVTVTADGVELRGVAIRTAPANKSALHIYKVETALNNITLDNTRTAGGAAMLVNGGTVRISGDLNLLLGENSWGGINVDTTNGDAGVVFEDGSQVSLTGNGQNAIYVDEEDRNNGNTVTITGAEEAGLVPDEEGNYVASDSVTDPDPEQPEDPEGDSSPEENDGSADDENQPENENPAEDGFTEDKKQENSADEKLTKAPKTGDTAGLPYAALAALTGSAAAAGIVLKKKIRLG